MKRRLFNILAAASLVLCLALIVLWVPSYRRVTVVARIGRGELAYLICALNEGSVLVWRQCVADGAVHPRSASSASRMGVRYTRGARARARAWTCRRD